MLWRQLNYQTGGFAISSGVELTIRALRQQCVTHGGWDEVHPDVAQPVRAACVRARQPIRDAVWNG
jgi:hypothetical protein